jgi:xylulokinase
MPRVLIGLDLGTTNAKAAAYDLDGQTLAEAAVGYPTYYPAAGWAEQQPRDWLTALADVLRKLSADLGERRRDVAGLALSAHGPGLVLVDEHGQSLTQFCPTWQDERCVEQGRRLLDAVGPGWIGIGMPLSGFPAKLLWAVEHQSDAARRAKYALGVKEYVVCWLTGQVVTEPSSGPGNADWWPPVFAACGWPVRKLARVMPSTAVAGELLPALCTEFGLPKALPVVMGLNDGASAALANGMVIPGESTVTLATNGVARIVVEQPISPDTRLANGLFCWPYVNGTWVTGGFAKSAASALQWLAGVVNTGGSEAYLDVALAESAAAAGRDVIFLPYLMGRGTPHNDPEARGAFLNLTLATTRGDLFRAVLEGVAFALRDIFERLARLGPVPGRIHISGGGARSDLWRQIVADVLQRTVIYSAADSTLGAAIVAAVGLGLHRSFAEAVAAMTRALHESIPRADTTGRYARLYAEYQRLCDALYPGRESLVDRTITRAIS